MPPQSGPQGAPPRTFFLHLLIFRDKDKILRVARVVGELCYQNNRLLLFPDYSVETQKLCKSFDAVKAALRTRRIKYSVLFPAKLRIVDDQFIFLPLLRTQLLGRIPSFPGMKLSFFPSLYVLFSLCCCPVQLVHLTFLSAFTVILHVNSVWYCPV